MQYKSECSCTKFVALTAITIFSRFLLSPLPQKTYNLIQPPKKNTCQKFLTPQNPKNVNCKPHKILCITLCLTIWCSLLGLLLPSHEMKKKLFYTVQHVLKVSILTWKHSGTTDSRTSPLVTMSSIAALKVHSLGRAPVGQNFSTLPALTNWGTYSRGSVSQRTPAMQFRRALGFTHTVLQGPWFGFWLDDGMLSTKIQPWKKIKHMNCKRVLVYICSWHYSYNLLLTECKGRTGECWP